MFSVPAAHRDAADAVGTARKRGELPTAEPVVIQGGREAVTGVADHLHEPVHVAVVWTSVARP